MSRLIVTLDGPAGVGKSSLAKTLAKDLHLTYLDTGAMFRALALAFSNQGTALPQLPPAELRDRLSKHSFSLEKACGQDGEDGQTSLKLDGRCIGDEIRTEEVGALAAQIAKLEEVREFLKRQQRKLGQAFDLVAEGRDMGTVVFPQARYKFFLEARAEVRAKRRFEQLREAGVRADLELLTRQIAERDQMDRNRVLSPLLPADDATIIDTSDLNMAQVLAILREQVKSCAGGCTD